MCILGVIIRFINIYLSLIFRLSLELISYKFFIYLGVIVFLFLSIMTNLNYKINVYDKIKNFIESW